MQRTLRHINAQAQRLILAGSLIVALVLSSFTSASAASNAWSFVAPLPDARYGLAAAAAADGKIYAFGGTDSTGAAQASNFAYDPIGDTWTTAAPMPTARLCLAATTGADGTIYVLGGSTSGVNSLTTAEAFHPASNTWTTLPPMPTPRACLAAATGPDGKVYAIGGTNPYPTPLDSVDVYDPSTNSWTSAPAMPRRHYGPSAVTGSDGRIYVVGGYDPLLGGYNGAVEAYDTATSTWTSLASTTVAHGNAAAALAPDGRVLAIGGNVQGGDTTNVVEVYDSSTDTWSPFASLQTARFNPAAANSADGRVFVMGGYSPSGGGYQSSVESYGDAPPQVVYQFQGFFSPIDNLPTVNKAKAGQTIPVKWRITDANGVGISDPASFVSITSGSTSCSPSDPIDVVETYSGNSGLQYQGNGNWQFNWKTPKSYAGQCRVMRLNLADGSTSRIAEFQFK